MAHKFWAAIISFYLYAAPTHKKRSLRNCLIESGRELRACQLRLFNDRDVETG